MTESKPKKTATRGGTRRTKKEIPAPSIDAAMPVPETAPPVREDAATAEQPKKRPRRPAKKKQPEGDGIVPAAETVLAKETAPPVAAEDSVPKPKPRKPRRSAAPATDAAQPAAQDTDTAVSESHVAAQAGSPDPEGSGDGEEISGARPRRRRSRRGGKNRGLGSAVSHEPGAPVEAHPPVGVPSVPGQQHAEAAEPAEAQPGQAQAGMSAPPPGESAEGSVATGKRRRRRRRKRSRGDKGADGQPLAPGIAAGADSGVGDEEDEDGRDEGTAASVSGDTGTGSGAGVGGADASTGAPKEEGSRRSRSSRRRRGKGGTAHGKAENGLPDMEVAPLDETVDEAAVPVPEFEDEDLEGDVEYTDTSGSSDSRKVMMIDGTHPEEIRVAIVNDNVLDYFEFENQRRKQFKGNIYKGKVINIAPAIEAAFVEFGGGRHGFLPLNEYCGGALTENLENWDEGEKRPSLRSGMEILVQVTKEESSVKGAALTSYISIAGRYLVMMLGMKRFGISKKITSEKERERLRKQMEKLEYPEHLGFIVRTEGEGRNLKDLKADLQNLIRLWHRVLDGGKTLKAPALLYEEQDIVIRTLRDSYSSDFAEVLMNSEDSHRKAVEFFDIYYPKQKNKLKLYRQKRPLFSKFNLDEQLDKATARRVGLPSGGHIVIDRTEALWSIDVNSGRSSKDRDIEDTAFRTNTEAAIEVTRQLRIRDMGGLIVVDFIDMENKNHIKEVERTIKDGLRKDKAKNDVSAMGKFGLVAISRQRMGISFFDVMLKDCDLCSGTGFVATSDALAVRLLRKLHDEMSREGTRELVARVYPSLLETLLNQKREEISRLERLCNTRVTFVADGSLPPGGFHITQAPQAAGA